MGGTCLHVEPPVRRSRTLMGDTPLNVDEVEPSWAALIRLRLEFEIQ